MELKHVVVFHTVQAIVEKVKCLTCGSEHKYHPEKKQNPGRTERIIKKSPETARIRNSSEFATLSAKFAQKESVPYSLSGTFKVEDVIDHKTFGRGYVVSASFQKMTVVFSDETRIMACNR